MLGLIDNLVNAKATLTFLDRTLYHITYQAAEKGRTQWFKNRNAIRSQVDIVGINDRDDTAILRWEFRESDRAVHRHEGLRSGLRFHGFGLLKSDFQRGAGASVAPDARIFIVQQLPQATSICVGDELTFILGRLHGVSI
jgi:hypothetical protein